MIELREFGVRDTGDFAFEAVEGGRRSTIAFRFPDGYVPSDDLLAISISTLLGKKFSRIKLELCLSPDVKAGFERLVAADVDCQVSSAGSRSPLGQGIALNFSGGFDSLAAKVLLPRETQLVSLDFGGAFSREREFFERFSPTTIRTNFREEGFASNSWAFMGVGPILLRDYLEIDAYSFGSILEASPFNFIDGLKFRNVANPWFALAGLRQVNPVLGLTEVGTAMLLLCFAPEHISNSLTSLASPNSEKLARKVLLVDLASRLDRRSNGLSIPTMHNGRDAPFLRFGDSFATDFLAIYILKKGGAEMASVLVSDIPDEAFKITNTCSLNFYERLNTDFYNDLPRSLAKNIVKMCIEAGIGLYDQTDWQEFARVRSLLSKYHTIPE